MMVMNRQQFADHIDDRRQGLGKIGSKLWGIENANGFQCEYFIGHPYIDTTSYDQQKDFWDWCEHHLEGRILCYYSTGQSGNREYWGFTHKTDIVLFLLRWS